MPPRKIWNENIHFLKKFEKIWPYHQRKWTIFVFEIWNENFCFWNLKKMAIPPEVMKKMKYFVYVTKKNWKKISFLKFEMKIFVFETRKKFSHTTVGKWKKMKWRSHIFRLCHREKTVVPPMYTTLYYMCKLWWYIINLNRGIRWYGFRKGALIILEAIPVQLPPLNHLSL
jgi:hypothetical protein